MKKIELIIENVRAGEVWGRVNYEDNLIVDNAGNIQELQTNLTVLLEEFHDIKPDDFYFEVSYDLTAFFEVFNYLNISNIAKYAGINPSLLRHYAAGSKTAGKDQVLKLQEAIHKAGQELTEVNFA